VAEKTSFLSVKAARTRLGSGDGPLGGLSDAFDAYLKDTVRNAPPAPGPWALLALGGYGRREMSPGSDVDIQFLVKGRPRRYEAMVEACLHAWWDDGLKLGYATRTVSDTVALAKSDHRTAMSLLDARLVEGDAKLTRELTGVLARKIYEPRRTSLFQAVLDERAERHHRLGDTVYLLEPDIKSGEGGLRDVHGARWAVQIVRSTGQLTDCGLTRIESDELIEAHDVLTRYRNVLHDITGRKTDRLRFAHQEPLATRFGDDSLADTMQRYWLAARKVRAYTRRVLDALRVDIHGHADETLPPRTGLSSMDLVAQFRESSVRDLPLHPDTLTTIAERITEVDDTVRANQNVAQDFFAVLTEPSDRALPLARMHDIGLLTSYIPVLSKIRGLYQHNVFHVYTVDLHTLHGIAALKTLASESETEKPSIRHRIFRNLTAAEHRIVFLAFLLHDIGKGGADPEAAYGVAKQLGLDDSNANRVAFLVREHLLLALLAQTRDIHDVATLRHLAREAGDQKNLDMLFLVTWADMSSANPELLTEWKSTLLEQLYLSTSNLLTGGLDLFADQRHIVHQRRSELLTRLLGAEPEHPTAETREVDAFIGHLATRYFVVSSADDIVLHMQMCTALADQHGVLAIDDSADTVARITVCSRDSPGLLTRLSGTMAAHRYNIISAEVFSRTDGIVIDVFSVEKPINWDQLKADLEQVVANEHGPEASLRERERPSPLGERPTPIIETCVTADNDASDHSTVIDVTARDRPGLLYRVTRALHHLGLDIRLARISTEGDTAHDAFYVCWLTGGKIINKKRLDHVVDAVHIAVDEPL
jgi:[protein-PII] uridylyltransferase